MSAPDAPVRLNDACKEWRTERPGSRIGKDVVPHSWFCTRMPYKFNESRRHKIPTAKHRATNWPEYDAALVKPGSLTVWFTDEAIAAWRPPATGKRGGQPTAIPRRSPMARSCTSNGARAATCRTAAVGLGRASLGTPIIIRASRPTRVLEIVYGGATGAMQAFGSRLTQAGKAGSHQRGMT
jgi:hypothetical protein